MPESANVYDSLGEAFERRGSLPGALKNYRIASQIGERTGHPAVLIFKANLDRVEKSLENRPGRREGSEGNDRSLSP